MQGQIVDGICELCGTCGWQLDRDNRHDGTAVNYWWGMNSGVMDVLLSRELPHDVRHLANILRSGIIAGSIDPLPAILPRRTVL